MCKKLFFFFGFGTFALAGFSQMPPGAYSGAAEGNEPLAFRAGIPNTKGISPNVSAFRRIAEVGVDMFNGISTLSLPLYQLSGEQMQFDVGLSYYGGGVRVNEIAGSVGLSWTLDGEYQINRVVNDLPDEWYNTAPASYKQYANRDMGYLYTAKRQLDHNNWNTPTFLGQASFDPGLLFNAATVENFLFDGEPDEFRFSLPNGVSGSFYRDHTAAPNNVSAWKVKSKSDLTLEITHELHVREYNNQMNFYPFQLDKWSGGAACNIPTLFTKFTIVTPDGYRYIFGGIESAMEVSRGILAPPGEVPLMITAPARYTVNTWKLSKIVAPSGEEINFNYSRGKILFNRSRDIINGVDQGADQWTSAILEVSASATYPVYLSSIETKKQILYFKHSQAVEQWYPVLPALGCQLSSLGPSGNNAQFSFLLLRNDFNSQYAENELLNTSTNPDGKLSNYNQQLDSVILFDKLSNQSVSGYKLVQSANPSQRRTLDKIFKFNFTDNKIQDNYEFTYHNVAGLPELEAWNRDFWGFEQAGDPNPVAGCGTGNFYQLRPTTGNFTTKGLLQTIKNPLGGTTKIDYETNIYSRQIKVDVPNSSVGLIDNLSGDNYGPGARVKKITRSDYQGGPDTYKEYFYTNNYPSLSRSSGLLNFDNIKIDAIKGNCGSQTSTLANYSTLNHTQFTKQFKGGIVNYSEVTERNADGSYTVFNYTNAENPDYRDEYSVGYSGNVVPSSNLNFRLSSKDLDRGKIKTVKQYTSANRLVKQTENIYQDNPARTNNYIKAISDVTLASMNTYFCMGQAEPGLANHRAWAFKVYTYKNPLIKSIETNYYESSPDVVTEMEYDYDQYGNIVTTRTKDSDGNVVRKTVKYNSHTDYDPTATENTASGIRKLKYQYGIKNFPVETMVSLLKPPAGGVVTPPAYVNAQLNTVNVNKPMLQKRFLLRAANGVPEGSAMVVGGFTSSKINTSGVFEMDSRYVLEEEVTSFTTGNALAMPKPATVNSRQDGNYALTWDYSGFYASSKTTNASVSEIAYSGFDGTYSGNNAVFKNGWNFNEANIHTGVSFTGQRSLRAAPVSSGIASNAFITTNNFVAGKLYKISFWARSVIGNMYLANGNSATVLTLKKTGKDNWRYYEAEFVANGTVGLVYASSSIIPINVNIDELMLVPMNAQMESYCYNTGTGNISAVNTGNGNVLFYEYDGLGRLIVVRDDNGNVLKNHTYKLQNN